MTSSPYTFLSYSKIFFLNHWYVECIVLEKFNKITLYAKMLPVWNLKMLNFWYLLFRSHEDYKIFVHYFFWSFSKRSIYFIKKFTISPNFRFLWASNDVITNITSPMEKSGASIEFICFTRVGYKFVVYLSLDSMSVVAGLGED